MDNVNNSQDVLQRPEIPGHRKLLERLYLLAQLKPGKTLSDKSMTVIDHTKFNSWYRWWYDEGRVKSMDLVYTIIDEAKNYLENSTEEEPFEEKKTVLAALNCARDGIETLLETYSEDSQISARVKTISAEIQIMVKHHQPVLAPILWPKFSPTLGALAGITSQPPPNKELNIKKQPVVANKDNSTLMKKEENLDID